MGADNTSNSLAKIMQGHHEGYKVGIVGDGNGRRQSAPLNSTSLTQSFELMPSEICGLFDGGGIVGKNYCGSHCAHQDSAAEFDNTMQSAAVGLLVICMLVAFLGLLFSFYRHFYDI